MVLGRNMENYPKSIPINPLYLKHHLLVYGNKKTNRAFLFRLFFILEKSVALKQNSG